MARWLSVRGSQTAVAVIAGLVAIIALVWEATKKTDLETGYAGAGAE